MIEKKEILKRLRLLKGNYPELCRQTKLDYNYITKLASGAFKNPGVDQIDTLRKSHMVRNYKRYIKR